MKKCSRINGKPGERCSTCGQIIYEKPRGARWANIPVLTHSAPKPVTLIEAAALKGPNEMTAKTETIQPNPRQNPAGTHVRLTADARNYTDVIPAGTLGTVVWYSPEHHSSNGGGYTVHVAIEGQLFLGPDFDAMGGKWEGPDGKTILTRNRPSVGVWSRNLEVIR